MSPHRELRHTIVRLLSNMASAKEIQQYLRRFSQLDAIRFAVIVVDDATLRDDLDSLVSSLAFLQQVGLAPIVLHGAGPRLDDELTAAGMKPRVRNGVRVISAEALAIVRRVFHSENLRLVEALHSASARASSITGGVFESELVSRRTYGLVGRVTRVHVAPIEASLRAGSIPIVASLGETSGGQILDLDADAAAGELVHTLQPYKIIVLTPSGGLLDAEDRLISSINLSTEYEALLEQPWLAADMRGTLEHIHGLLATLPLSSSVSITRPAELAKELFTHRGSGTLVRMGESIRRYTSWSQLDTGRLRTLVESGFRRRLAADYFEHTTPYRVYVSKEYRAALLITLENDIPHLDKFAVAEDAQGEGLGRAAWQRMREETPKLFWRARPDNPVNEFYFEEADGCIKGAKWNVYWYGLESFDEIRYAVEHCRARPATLKG